MNETEYRELLKQHPEMATFIEFVSPNPRAPKGYYRVIPFTRFDPHPNQLKTMIAFGETAYRSYGMKGLDFSTGKLLPPVAAKIRKELRGKKFRKPTFEETFKKLKKLAKIIGQEIEAKKLKAKAI